jgi:ABC-type uncharacterized transport system substrate-binding protein
LKKCGVAGYGHDPEQIGADLAGLASEILQAKISGGKIKSTAGNLILNKKIAQMYNYNFPAQATALGIQTQ